MSGASYKDSGVDITEGDNFVTLIKPLAKSTRRLGADADLGGFGGLFDLAACKYNDPVLVAANDGVGTKLLIAINSGIHHTIGIDLVAMCVNDLVVQGAEPLFFLDYFATGGLDLKVAENVVRGIAAGCKLANCALIGGETAEMPGMYAKGHYDLAGFAVGAVERDQILPSKDINEGDVIIGIKSSGLHSNGYSLVRYLIDKNKLSYQDAAPFASGKNLAEALLEPTKIYVKPCLELAKKNLVKAFAHITGGGFIENIPRVLPEQLAAKINFSTKDFMPVFSWLMELGKIDPLEMLRTFNCGIGMIAVTKPDLAEQVISILRNHQEEAVILGNIGKRDGEAVVF